MSARVDIAKAVASFERVFEVRTGHVSRREWYLLRVYPVTKTVDR